jgi:chorismate mutase
MATSGAVLDRSLVGTRNLIDRSLSEVRVAAGLPAHHRRFSLADFIAEVKAAAMIEADVRECK